MKKQIQIGEGQIGKRIDLALAELDPDISRAKFKQLILDGKVVFSDGTVVPEPKYLIKTPCVVEIDLSDLRRYDELIAEDIPLDIIYEDDDILVINKQPGIAVHPGSALFRGTILNALLARFANFAERFHDKFRAGIVHRLDKDTSGVLLIAKKQAIKDKLSELFALRKVSKTYLAIVYGIPKNEFGIIETGFGRHPVKRERMAVVKKAERKAITEYNVLKKFEINSHPCALLEVKIHTGRTHQIRVHMAYIKTPVLGDKTYGGKQEIEPYRQMLHAWKLSFVHPLTGKEQEFKAEIPGDFKKLCGDF